MDNDSENKPKRRVRYKGTHPRRFHEKYKELNPDKYSQEIEKVKARGHTPAGSHIPICLSEIIEALRPELGQVILDATLGYGGHAMEFLKRVGPSGFLIGLDQDPIERPKTTARLQEYLIINGLAPESLIVGAINFSNAKSFLRQCGKGQVDMVLADLGLSSMQIDTPERGFSFKVDAPFDLRMNPDKGEPANVILAAMKAGEIAQLLVDNSDELRASQIAEQLVKDKPQTTLAVAASVETAMSKMSFKVREKEGTAPIRRVFQAFRILVNDEFGVLDTFLQDLPDMLKSGGRVAVLSFHSGEDRRVKKAFQAFFRAGEFSQIALEPIRPSFQEQNTNPRSKSAKLRWAVRR
jgi:16S rRNA (cytosine1402-N4)-methyltransferase